MMVPQYLIDALVATGVYGEVSAAPMAASAGMLSTADELVAVLNSSFSGAVHAVTMGDDKTEPSVVYQLVSSRTLQTGGYALAREDIYVLSARGRDLALLTSTVDQAFADLAASPYGTEVTDMQLGYDDAQGQYRCDVELAFSVSATGGALPAALVVPLGYAFEPMVDWNCPEQNATGRFGVVLINVSSDMAALEQAARSALIGLQDNSLISPVELEQSLPMDGPGGLQLWQLIISQQQTEGGP